MSDSLSQQITHDKPGALTVRGLTHAYGGALAIEDISFGVEPGEIVALLGPSGCGKSTILRAIAGLVRPSSGAITLGSTDVTNLPARSRGIGMVFQNYALFPHLTVAENIDYPLACQRVARAVRRERVRELVELVRLSGYKKRLPRELSGGQQQRVAVARALAASPSLLLLDEPFGALDRALRFDLQVEMLRLQKSVGITTLIVTHDQEEAQSLASRLVLVNRGHIEQIDTPAAVYDRPASLFVNTFIGQANQMAGTVAEVGANSSSIRLAGGAMITLPRRLGFVPGAPVVVTCRPEEARLVPLADAGACLEGRLVLTLPLGPTLVHEIDIPGGTDFRVTEPRALAAAAASPGEPVAIAIDTARCHVFPAIAASSATSPSPSFSKGDSA